MNPWKLQAWLGHKRIEETMGYVHVASDHQRALPEIITVAAAGENDPDRRVIATLGARANVVPTAPSNAAANPNER